MKLLLTLLTAATLYAQPPAPVKIGGITAAGRTAQLERPVLSPPLAISNLRCAAAQVYGRTLSRLPTLRAE